MFASSSHHHRAAGVPLCEALDELLNCALGQDKLAPLEEAVNVNVLRRTGGVEGGQRRAEGHVSATRQAATQQVPTWWRPQLSEQRAMRRQGSGGRRD